MTPGPKEFTAEELQHLMALVTTDLVTLYEEGFNIPTPLFPNGIYIFISSLSECLFFLQVDLSAAHVLQLCVIIRLHVECVDLQTRTMKKHLAHLVMSNTRICSRIVLSVMVRNY